MPVEETFPVSLQESILAALVFDERAGAAIAAQILPQHFDDTYRQIAERVLAYRRKYGRPPGRAHLDDLFGKLLQSSPRTRRMLFGLVDLADGMNGDYIVSRTQEFIREQQLKGALIEANTRYEAGGENVAVDVEQIFSGALRHRAQTLDAGTFLNDTARSLKFLDHNTGGVSLGIKELDNIGLMLFPGELILDIAPKGSGKTWSCVDVGVHSLKQRQKVLHITLEMPEDKLTGRYYQRMFAAAARPDKYDKTFLEFDKLGRVAGFKTRLISPRWNFANPGARRELLKRIKPWGTRLGRLVVKHFPSGTLTVAHLEGYLDYLEVKHGFIPTVLIIDYPDIMAQDTRNYRISLGRTFIDIRGVLSKRNMAGYMPTQGNRSSLKASKVSSDMVAEDVSKLNTADNVLTYSCTEAEKVRGLARIHVAHARNGAGDLTVIVTQSYATGQYVLQSALMQQAYWDRLKAIAGDDDNE